MIKNGKPFHYSLAFHVLWNTYLEFEFAKWSLFIMRWKFHLLSVLKSHYHLKAYPVSLILLSCKVKKKIFFLLTLENSLHLWKAACSLYLNTKKGNQYMPQRSGNKSQQTWFPVWIPSPVIVKVVVIIIISINQFACGCKPGKLMQDGKLKLKSY